MKAAECMFLWRKKKRYSVYSCVHNYTPRVKQVDDQLLNRNERDT